jgi:hypothetical protein
MKFGISRLYWNFFLTQFILGYNRTTVTDISHEELRAFLRTSRVNALNIYRTEKCFEQKLRVTPQALISMSLKYSSPVRNVLFNIVT